MVFLLLADEGCVLVTLHRNRDLRYSLREYLHRGPFLAEPNKAKTSEKSRSHDPSRR